MARLHDKNGNLLGGLTLDSRDTRLIGHNGLASEASATTTVTLPYVPPQPLASHLNPMFGPEEIVPGLECSYGSLAYCYSHLTDAYLSEHPRRFGCHNPTETPDERHHCDACGGDYCTVHAEPAAHDCECVIKAP